MVIHKSTQSVGYLLDTYSHMGNNVPVINGTQRNNHIDVIVQSHEQLGLLPQPLLEIYNRLDI